MQNKDEVINIKRTNDFEIAKPAKAGLFYITTNVLTKAIALFTTPLFTRLLLPEEYGVYSLYVSWMGILSVFLALGISGGAVYRGLGKFKGSESEFISSATGILLVPFLALLLVSLIFVNRIKSLTGLPAFAYFLLLLEVFLNSCEMIAFALYRYKYLYLRICVANLLRATLSVGGALFLIYLTPLRAEARILSSFFASLFAVLPNLRGIIKLKKFFDGKIWRYMAKLSLPILPSSIAMTLIAQSDKLIIERYSGAAELGKYSIAYSVGFMLTALSSAALSAIQPWLMRKLNSGAVDSAKALLERIIFLSSMGLLLFLLLTPEIFKIIAGPTYRDAEAAVYALAVAGILQFIGNLISSNLIHAEKTARLSAAALTALIFNVGANLFLIPRFGYKAAAITTAVSYALLIALEYLLLSGIKCEKTVEAKSLSPLMLSLLAIPIYLFREAVAARLIFALAALLCALPSLFLLLKAFIERKGNKAGA